LPGSVFADRAFCRLTVVSGLLCIPYPHSEVIMALPSVPFHPPIDTTSIGWSAPSFASGRLAERPPARHWQSDDAAAVGLNPYKSQLELWLEKTGRDGLLPKTDPLDEESPAYWGTFSNPSWQRTTPGVPAIVCVVSMQSFSIPIRSCTGCWPISTGKSSAHRTFRSSNANRRHQRQPTLEEGVPEYVQLQVQHQLVVTGKAAAWLCCSVVSTWRFIAFSGMKP
jgi:hypothetical protein